MLQGFFVEMYYDHLANEMLERVRTFTSVTCLEEYAYYVNLKDLAS